VSQEIKIIDTTADNILELGVCGYKSLKKPGFPEKLEWLNERFRQGLKIKTLYSEKHGTQGMVEYIPGKYCWRPVEANGYMFIHCLFVGFKKEYKHKGFASLLLDECENAAKNDKMHGITIITRKGSFMVGKDLFVKRGYEGIDKIPPDFELLVKKYDKNAPDPKFKEGLTDKAKQYSDGLTIIRAAQCPYTVKNVNEIKETAKKIYGLKTNIIDLKTHIEAQDSPCAFGSFCIIFNGKRIAEHPISNKRFSNIMDKLLK